MTVSSSTNKVSFSGNGTLTTFAYSFKIFDQDDLTVILRAANGTETTQTITTHYTVTGVGSASGGNVVFGTAPASGVTVVIIREQPLTQGLDLVPNDPFPAQSLEESLDKLTFMAQKHEEELSRAIKGSRTNVIANSEFTVSATDRANKVFAFDSSGNLSITQELGTFKGDWAASTAYVERDLVKDTSTNNVFIVNAAHTSSGSQPLTTNTNSSKYEKIIDITNPPGNFSVGGNLAVTGSVTGASFVIGSADINENDLEAIDGVTAGTVAASKAVVVDVNKDISSFRNLTASGIVNYGSLSDGSITVTAFVDEDNMASNSATLIPTQQSVKAYVDSQVGASDTLTEILGNGNTTSGTNIQLTTTDEVQFRDTALKISSSADGQLDIDADTEVEITAPTVDINASTEVNISGDLTVDTNTLHVDSSNNRVGIKTTSPDNELTVIGTGFFGASTAGVGLSNSGADLAVISGQTPSGTYKPLKITSNGPTNDYVYFDTTSGIGISNETPSSFNSKLVIGGTSGSNTMTIASGTTGVGNIHFADGTSGDALDAGYIRYHHQFDRLVLGTASATVEPLRITSSGSVGIKVSGDPSTELEVNGTITGTGFASTGNMTFGDNNKALFGAGSDLQIYHDGSNSYISDQGDGQLILLGSNAIALNNAANTENMLVAFENGSVDLYYDNSKKLATTSTGIDVTGNVTADGLTVDGAAQLNGDLTVFDATGDPFVKLQTNEKQYVLRIDNSESDVFQIRDSSSSANRLAIASNGDISFYEDTGTTAKLFWDASAESLGIGTSSPSRPLQVTDATSDGTGGFKIESYLPTLEMDDISGGGTSFILQHDGTSTLFKHDTTEHMRIANSGHVGINFSDPASTGSRLVVLGDAGSNAVFIKGNTGSGTSWGLGVNAGSTSADASFRVYDKDGSNSYLYVRGDGNVGIGTAAPSSHLHVKSTSDNIVATRVSTNSVDALFQSIESASLAQIGTVGSHAFTFFTANQERMRISSDGSVGIDFTPKTLHANVTSSLNVGSSSQFQRSKDSYRTSNFYYNSSDVGTSIASGYALVYTQDVTNGKHAFTTSTASAGSADATVSLSERMVIDSSGNVGIGTSSPLSASNYTALTVQNNTYGGIVQVKDDTVDLRLQIQADTAGRVGTHSNHPLRFDVNSTERMRIDSSGNVGIGRSAPSHPLHIGNTSGNAVIELQRTNTNTSGTFGAISFTASDDHSVAAIHAFGDGDNEGAHLIFRTTSAASENNYINSTSERMRIDSSGNLLLGTTDTTIYNDAADEYGFMVEPSGQMQLSANNATMLYLNRQNGDGELLSFRKDGSTVGSIGSQGGLYCYMGSSSNTDAYTAWADGVFKPSTSTGTNNDNAMDLGNVSSRWNDIYATNGTIQTSDRNEKQDIAELTDAEQKVAVAAKGLLRKFRWKDKVAEKGDKARTHFGIIAQDLQAAFAAEGLDAGDYAMFISSTWTDEETGEERTRMGVRYSELLAFIIAAI